MKDGEHTRIDAKRAKSMAAVGTPIARGAERGFCPYCVLQAPSPIWRRDWMEATATWCFAHQVPLVACDQISQLGHVRHPAVHNGLLDRAREATAARCADWVPRLALEATALDAGGTEDCDLRDRLLDCVVRRLLTVLQDYSAAVSSPDSAMTLATGDRPVHHETILEISVDSNQRHTALPSRRQCAAKTKLA